MIALIFRSIHQKLAITAAVIAMLLGGALGAIQLIEAWSGEDLTISMSPSSAQAFDSTGPIALDITVSRGDTPLTTTSLAQSSLDNFANSLRNIGWRPAVECLDRASIPSFWSTNRVYAGQNQQLGQTDFGLLRISALQFTGTGDAVVTLELVGSGQPVPDQLAIKNKGIGVQSFPGLPEFFVAVREADFQDTPPWAAFTIFTR